MKKLIWLEKGWLEYQEWLETNHKMVKKINSLIKSIMQDGKDKGIGKPEALKGEMSGYYSRHIDKKNRLLYYIAEYDGEEVLIISSCKCHYGDK